MRLANSVEVLLRLELLELAWDRLGLARIRGRVLLFESLLQHHVLVGLLLVGEHVNQGFESFKIA